MPHPIIVGELRRLCQPCFDRHRNGGCDRWHPSDMAVAGGSCVDTSCARRDADAADRKVALVGLCAPHNDRD